MFERCRMLDAYSVEGLVPRTCPSIAGRPRRRDVDEPPSAEVRRRPSSGELLDEWRLAGLDGDERSAGMLISTLKWLVLQRMALSFITEVPS